MPAPPKPTLAAPPGLLSLKHTKVSYSPSSNWTPRHEWAAYFIAEAVNTDRWVAGRLKVHEVTLNRWKGDAMFLERVNYYRAKLIEHVWEAGTAKKEQRIRAYDRRSRELEDVIKERGEWFAANEPDIPGGATGLLVRTVKLDNKGNQIVSYEVDTGLIRAQKTVLEMIAREKGELIERHQVLTTTVTAADLDPDLAERVRRAALGDRDPIVLSEPPQPD